MYGRNKNNPDSRRESDEAMSFEDWYKSEGYTYRVRNEFNDPTGGTIHTKDLLQRHRYYLRSLGIETPEEQ